MSDKLVIRFVSGNNSPITLHLKMYENILCYMHPTSVLYRQREIGVPGEVVLGATSSSHMFRMLIRVIVGHWTPQHDWDNVDASCIATLLDLSRYLCANEAFYNLPGINVLLTSKNRFKGANAGTMWDFYACVATVPYLMRNRCACNMLCQYPNQVRGGFDAADMYEPLTSIFSMMESSRLIQELSRSVQSSTASEQISRPCLAT